MQNKAFKFKNFLYLILDSNLFLNLLPLILGFVFSGLLISLMNYSPFKMYKIMFDSIFSNPKHIAYILSYSSYLMLTGLSIAISLKAGLFNLGIEGQYIIGLLVAGILGINISLPIYLHVPLILITAIFFGGLLGLLIAYLRVKYKIHEVISGIMFNWILFYIYNMFFEFSFIKKPNSDFSQDLQESAILQILSKWKFSSEGFLFRREWPILNEILKAPLNWGILIALIITLSFHFIINKSIFGYKLRSVGLNISASRRAGINVSKIFYLSLFISASLASLAGALQVMGVYKYLYKMTYLEGNSFNGIAVALIGNNSPLGVIFATLLFASLIYSGGRVQSLMGLSSAAVSLIIGLVILLISSNYFLKSLLIKRIKTYVK